MIEKKSVISIFTFKPTPKQAQISSQAHAILKLAYLRNNAADSNQILQSAKTTKYSSRVILYMLTTNPIWRTAAIFETDKTPNLFIPP